MRRTKSSMRFEPTLAPLESRELLSTLSARLSGKGVLTISRDDAALVIDINVLTAAAKKVVKPTKGTVVVQGVGKFDLKKVKSITINPGPSTANVTIHAPKTIRIPVRILPTTAPPPVIKPPANGGGIVVPGVTGIHSAFEQQIFDLVNAERVKAGLSPLKANSKLITAAQIQARNMASLGILDHNLPGVDQPTLPSRASFVGYSFSTLGENLGAFFNDAASLVAGWMASSAHRANILNPSVTEAGLGVGRDAQGNLYMCQVFGAPLA